jgi:pimeloyl-ACP methyl ester carboxylesterase
MLRSAVARQAGYIPANGANLYYELHGAGQPLILLHGGLGTVDTFAGLLPELAAGRRVVPVELQGHGRSPDMDRPFRFEQMAGDVAELIRRLRLGRADILGYSLGGGVALHAAIRHPELVRRLVLISTPYAHDGWYPDVRAGMDALDERAAQAMVGSLPHDAYTRVAPRPEHWSRLVVKTGDLLRQPYDLSDEVARLQLPLLLIAGDRDSIRPAHLVSFFELLGGGQGDDQAAANGSQLAILPGATHYNILFAPALAPLLAAFLGKRHEEPAPARQDNLRQDIRFL